VVPGQQQAAAEQPVQPREEAGKAGRDLKESRHRREVGGEMVEEMVVGDMVGENQWATDLEAKCLNDPLCEAKFSRNPASDSLVDRDFVKYLKVGTRSLLNSYDDSVTDANLTKEARTVQP
jgi:hypothetical protein